MTFEQAKNTISNAAQGVFVATEKLLDAFATVAFQLNNANMSNLHEMAQKIVDTFSQEMLKDGVSLENKQQYAKQMKQILILMVAVDIGNKVLLLSAMTVITVTVFKFLKEKEKGQGNQ